jgi:hypothetical protein
MTTKGFPVEERVVDGLVEGGSKISTHSSHIFWGSSRYVCGTVQEFSWFNASTCIACIFVYPIDIRKECRI